MEDKKSPTEGQRILFKDTDGEILLGDFSKGLIRVFDGHGETSYPLSQVLQWIDAADALEVLGAIKSSDTKR